jgi:hypothetical protein
VSGIFCDTSNFRRYNSNIRDCDLYLGPKFMFITLFIIFAALELASFYKYDEAVETIVRQNLFSI